MATPRSNLRGAALLCIALVACTSSDDEESTPSSSSLDAPATTAAATSGPTAEPVTTAAAAGDPRAVLDEILGWMADPATLDPTRFSDEFLAVVPADQLVEGLESLGVGTWEASDVQGDEHGLIARLTGPGETLVVELALDDAGAIAGLLFQPAELSDPPTTLSGLTDRLAASAETTGVLVADVAADGTCLPVAALAPDDPIALGSVFKLYVLGAVTTAIADGTVSWDQAVPIRDELDSLPSGTTQDEPPGTGLPVRELALRMIAMSDNTATDHLIDLVGRDAVEAALGDLGHADPTLTMPFPTTRELFIIKADRDLLERYEAAGEAGRRELLAGEVAAAPLPGIDTMWTEPRAVDTVEWFASPADICRALVELSDRAATPGLEPIAEVLSANPGTEVDPEQFSSVLFKGGSEPGVLFAAWLATRADGSRLVVAGGATDTATELDQTLFQLLALGLTLT